MAPVFKAQVPGLQKMIVQRISSSELMRSTMADVTESAESRQLLENLKGRMLVLKEHL
jgi:hypothetical protein